jgi:hypothetical protein
MERTRELAVRSISPWEFAKMKSMSLKAISTAILLAGALTAASGCFAVAQNTQAAQPRPDRYAPLPPHQQPRAANAPDNGMAPSAREKALDAKINNICPGC